MTTETVPPRDTPYPDQDLTVPEATPLAEAGAPPSLDDDRKSLYDCVIVGGGPAGLTAAIYLGRYNRTAVVIDDGEGRSTTSEHNENYLGFPDGIAARELRALGQQQARRYGAHFVDDRVCDLRRDGEQFVATIGDGTSIRGRTIMLATGVVDVFPPIADIESCVGTSVFWCITCDGYKMRGKRVAVVGADDSAATTCMQLLNFTDQLTFLTDASHSESQLSVSARARLVHAGIPIIEGAIARVVSERGVVSEIQLAGGDHVATEIIMSQQGMKPNTALAEQLGVELEEGFVKTDVDQHTNVPLVYAAGDLTKLFSHQIVTAAHEGATAAQTANYDLYRPEQQEE